MEDSHKSNTSLRMQGLALLFYKRACVCLTLARLCFPTCGINLITCLVCPHGNRLCCPFPSLAHWPFLQWPAPGLADTERKRERETGYTPALHQNSASAVFKAAVMHKCVRQLHLKPDRRFTSNRPAWELTKHTHRVNLPDTYDFSFLCYTLHFSLSAGG